MLEYSEESIEVVRKYWDSRPCNIRHSTETIGSQKYFEEVSKRRYLVEPHIIKFMELEKSTNLNVLELGCGIGTDGAQYAEHGANYFGVELSRESLDIAMKRFEINNLTGKFICSPIEELNLSQMILADGEKIDLSINSKFSPGLVYSFGVIHHTPDPRKALSNIVKQVKSGTEFRIMLYAKNSYKTAMIKARIDRPEAQDGCPIAYTYTPEQAEELFEQCGLAVEKIWQDHIFTYEIESYKKYIYKKEKWFEAMPSNIFNAMKSNLGWHLLIIGKKK
jgi:SAM-dependent methyltransferase